MKRSLGIGLLLAGSLVLGAPILAHTDDPTPHEEPVNYENRTDRGGQLPAIAGVAIVVVLVVLVAKKFGHKRSPSTPTV